MTTIHAPEPRGAAVVDRDGPAVAAVVRDAGYATWRVAWSADLAGLPYGTLDMTAIYAPETSGAGLAGRYGPAVAALASAASLDLEYCARCPGLNAAAVRSTEPLT
jgi:hypothetical protein